MQSEDFDSKIREAADHHHPAYDEKAWINMEKLLNKHLPREKDDKRRFLLFLLLFLLLGGGAWLFISKPWKENKQPVQAKQTVTQPAQVVTANTIPSDKDKKITEAGINSPVNADKKSSESGPSMPVQYSAATGNVFSKKEQRAGTNIIIATPVNNNKKINSSPPFSTIDDKIKQPDNSEQDKNRIAAVKTNTNNFIAEVNPAGKKSEPVAGADKLAAGSSSDQPVNEPGNKENAVIIQNKAAKKARQGTKKTNSFFFTLSVAPDISEPGTGNPGKVELLAGAGLGYTFKDRFSIRTGFYTGRKIYTALPGEYHPPADFWRYYPYLEKVDADCKVYEIPITLSYNFGSSLNHNWFVSGGLSSYLMKKETYNYFFKTTPSSQTVSREWTLLDKNKHYFSVLTLSAGYQRNINKTTSIMIEPYFKLPLIGVGYGKVKLNSAGLLFSVGIKPFNHLKSRDKLRH